MKRTRTTPKIHSSFCWILISFFSVFNTCHAQQMCDSLDDWTIKISTATADPRKLKFHESDVLKIFPDLLFPEHQFKKSKLAWIWKFRQAVGGGLAHSPKTTPLPKHDCSVGGDKTRISGRTPCAVYVRNYIGHVLPNINSHTLWRRLCRTRAIRFRIRYA